MARGVEGRHQHRELVREGGVPREAEGSVIRVETTSQRVASCARCGWRWHPRVKEPKTCPRCKRRRWGSAPREGRTYRGIPALSAEGEGEGEEEGGEDGTP